jgi:endonuclease YncB( thermonuclease family)
MKKLAKFLFVCILLAVNTLLVAKQLDGYVIKVADGDTLTVLTDQKKKVKIRLNTIDSPEKGQAFSNAARLSLVALCLHKYAVIVFKKKDRYGRILGRVYCEDVDVNLAQVSTGMAWVYRRSSYDFFLYDAEQNARFFKRGLWRQPHPTPPWIYRKHR